MTGSRQAAQQALEPGETADAATSREAAEELAEQTLAGLRVDRDDHGVSVRLAVAIALFLAVAWGFYSRRGGGINQRPLGPERGAAQSGGAS